MGKFRPWFISTRTKRGNLQMTKFMEEYFKKHLRRKRAAKSVKQSHPFKIGVIAKVKINAPLTPLRKKHIIPIKKREFSLDAPKKGRGSYKV